ATGRQRALFSARAGESYAVALGGGGKTVAVGTGFPSRRGGAVENPPPGTSRRGEPPPLSPPRPPAAPGPQPCTLAPPHPPPRAAAGWCASGTPARARTAPSPGGLARSCSPATRFAGTTPSWAAPTAPPLTSGGWGDWDTPLRTSWNSCGRAPHWSSPPTAR